MRHFLPAIVIVAIGLGGCNAFARSHDSGAKTTRDYNVGAFTKLAVAGAYDVEVRTGGQVGVHAEGGEKRLEAMEVKVDGNTLEIGSRKGMHWEWTDGGKVRLIVTVPTLEGAEIAGSGDVTVDRATGPDFKGSIAGSGDLKLASVDARSVKFEIAGSGSIQAAGKADSVKYDIAGSGNIDAPRLVAQTAAVSIAGSGGVKAHATGTAAIEIMGSGDIDLTGGAKCTVSKAGSGNVRCS